MKQCFLKKTDKKILDLVFLGYGQDEIMRIGAFGGLDHLGFGGTGATIQQVLAHRTVQKA